VLVQVLLIALITLLIVRWSIEGPIARAAQWMRALRTGRFVGPRADFPDLDLLRPLAHEVTTFAESLSAARTAAEKEAQLREAAESVWTADRLSVHIRSRLNESRLSRALYPRAPGQVRAGDCAGQWSGHSSRASAARI
jgi:trehalose 6-phosphate synthase